MSVFHRFLTIMSFYFHLFSNCLHLFLFQLGLLLLCISKLSSSYCSLTATVWMLHQTMLSISDSCGSWAFPACCIRRPTYRKLNYTGSWDPELPTRNGAGTRFPGVAVFSTLFDSRNEREGRRVGGSMLSSICPNKGLALTKVQLPSQPLPEAGFRPLHRLTCTV